MVKKKLDWKNPSRIVYFAFFKDFVDTERDLLGSYKDLEQPTKTRSSHFFEPLQQSIFNVSVPPPPLPTVKKPWYHPGLKFPCPLKRHNHEMSECKDFLSMSPKHRWDDIERYRFCLTCLRPCDICVGRFCPYQASVPEILVCQPCALNSQSKNPQRSPLNILMCRKNGHAASRAPTEQIHEQFSRYFGSTDTNNIHQKIQFTVNFMHQAYSLTPIKQLNQQKPEIIITPPPVIHSQTGELITNPNVKIIPEVPENAMYLMQILKIRNSEVLRFFDNLIDGDLGTRENLKCISEKSTSLPVVESN